MFDNNGVRAVSGFVTADGQFFDTEPDARFHAALFKLNELLEHDGMSLDMVDWINNRYTHLLAYLLVYKEVLNARRNISNPPEST